ISEERRRISSGGEFFGSATYLGSNACNSCHHHDRYVDWKKTWHSKMEREPSPATIIGDFDNRLINYKEVEAKTSDGTKTQKITFSIRTGRADGRYFFTVIDKDNAANNQVYDIAVVLGGKWDQGYEVKIGDNYLPAPIRWSVAAGEWLTPAFNP